MTRPTSISVQDLRRLSSARWLVPILALMSAEKGSRFGVLVRALKMSRSVLSRHLDILEDVGWIARNPGHGHPLRPEYMLTAPGRRIGRWCERVMQEQRRVGLERSDLGRWSMLLLVELDGDRSGFSALQKCLAPVTARALSLSLKQLMALRLVERSDDPRPIYGLTRQGTKLAQVITGEPDADPI